MPNPRNQRKSERTYDLKPTSITLKGQLFQVNDISSEGIGIILKPDSPRFFIGERLENIPIPLESGTVKLNGIVSHVSVTAVSEICGIRFLFSGDEFNTVLQFKKERMQSSSPG